MLFWRNDSGIITLCDRRGSYTGQRYHKTRIFMSNSTLNYSSFVYIYCCYAYIVQISINGINNVPELDRNLAVIACIGWTQLSSCIILVPGHCKITKYSQITLFKGIASMSAWHWFHGDFYNCAWLKLFAVCLWNLNPTPTCLSYCQLGKWKCM